ncbi:MAG: peptide deformylase [Gammaproteobacteria bacterium]|nr:peptide deformylase [Gammaproteobacteria bacterium]
MPTLLPILVYPHPNLRRVANPVQEVTPEVVTLVDNMIHTMYASNGIGLAAVQVDQPLRIIVLDVSEAKDSPHVFINPEIKIVGGKQTSEEGCLSVPGFFESVERAEVIRVLALDRDGSQFETEADGLKSICIQHEVDHLDGKVFVDYLSRLKQSRIRKKLLKTRAAA